MLGTATEGETRSRRRPAALAAGLVGLVLSASALTVVALHGPAAPRSLAAEPPAANGPNIVLITTDDQRTDDLRWMPRTRRKIGRQGVEFPNSIAPNPLCCPARAIWISGRYSHNNGITTNHGQYENLDHSRTLPVWLRDHGYRTAFIGKYLNGYTSKVHGMVPGWDIFDPQIEPNMYHYYKYSMYNSGSPVTPGEYLPDYVTERGSDYLHELADGSAPFFLWVSHFAPHGYCEPNAGVQCNHPRPQVALRHRDRFRDARSPSTRSPAFNEDDVSDKHRSVRDQQKFSHKYVNRVHRARIRSLQAVDEGVRDLIDTLRETGRLSDTVIVFSSDNGYLMGEHRLLRKTYAYASSLRVPLLIRGPGIPEGVVRNQLVTGLDLAPTILELAGIEVDGLDGTSLVPTFDDESALEPRTVLLQTGIRGQDDWFYRGVTTGRYTYLRYEDNGFVELYDHHRDPYELENVAREWRYAAVRRELAARTRKLAGCSGDSCRTEFGPMPKVWG